jgi:hypothetical protein
LILLESARGRLRFRRNPAANDPLWEYRLEKVRVLCFL